MRPPQQPETYDQTEDPMQDLAMEIYARLVISHINQNPPNPYASHSGPDTKVMQDLAKASRLAAQAFFTSQES